MAIYHLSVQTISRGKGKSCVASSAYRAGEKLHDERQDLNHDYTKKQGIESEIIAPSNSPSWVNDREKLWNEVDRAETRCNSRTAREINIALPLELSKSQQKEIVREYVKESFVDKGMVADVCFHFNDENNPHCHIMLTTREICQEGFTKKNRDWDKKEKVEEWRESWAKYSNKALEKAGCEDRIDHRSYKDQGIDQVPTIHLGKTSSEMEKKNIYNPRAEINKQIKELNKEKIIVLQEYRELKDKLEKEKINEAQKYSNLKPEEKAALQKVEKILNEPQTYENSNKALDKLNTIRQESTSKLSKIDFEVGVICKRITNINYNLDKLKTAENEFKELPKNMFGKYKDKDRAETLKSNIKIFSNNLTSEGYVSNVDIKLKENKIENLQKSSENLKLNINKIDNTSSLIKTGVKVLQNKELREFHKEYKEQFSQAKYLKYNDMKAIKAADELLGRPISIYEIRDTHRNRGERIDCINKELRDIENNGRRLLNAKACLKIIDSNKDIYDKWDTKIFGKAKFQDEHRSEKWHYDNAVDNLKTYGVKDKLDLRGQESTHEFNLKEVKPKLEIDKTTLVPSINVLDDVLRALDSALRTERSVQRQDNLKLTKAFRGKNMEDEIER
ncbi:MobQ family relaxase [Clostridium lacusfryxellense]|uniref:MobQ family relaxase n=1 Tax=Clostridium lacusfryxellense TaxID=205328 RepID=UPI001C0E692A|nr:MobQ family relaxase [Clostridium lacusfryxellense]MBU3114539.1 MobA/MobL family protein [Clostridium lacusfryxellense]